MGWTQTYRRPGQTVTEFIQAEYDSGSLEVLDVAVVNFTEAYIALKRPDGKVVADVWLLRHGTRSEKGSITFKDMSETMGPGYHSCPRRILDLLSPIEEAYPDNDEWKQGYAAMWRRGCEDRLALRESRRGLGKGTVIRFYKPMTFSDGVDRDTFTYEGRGNLFRAADGTRVRISNWRDRMDLTIAATSTPDDEKVAA